jgi:N-glycosylase/DNA lyase
MQAETRHTFLPARNYDLAHTLTSGQAFRWEARAGAWEGVIGSRWIRLQQQHEGLRAEVAASAPDWRWLTTYLQTDVSLDDVLVTFPPDPPLHAAVAACRGLRLLRQDPWECLASFILSSTKQIVQIRQIVSLLCQRHGEPVEVPSGHPPAWSFPTATRLAALSEAELRACKMGFRAPHLLGAARAVADGAIDLAALPAEPFEEARLALLRLRGVGEKIADCVLLFSCGFSQAFPVDVWVRKALRDLYFPRRRPSAGRLRAFTQEHFGPHAGYAQQYLFHYMRTRARSRPPIREDECGAL